MAPASVFLDVLMPTPATWLYVAAPLAVALFFQFTRLFCVRNLDVLTLFLFAPGLLLLGESHHLLQAAWALDPAAVDEFRQLRSRAEQFNLWGYVWLITASGYFLLRCLADLTLVRRPALGANLNLSGLAWLAGSLFVS